MEKRLTYLISQDNFTDFKTATEKRHFISREVLWKWELFQTLFVCLFVCLEE